MNWRIGELQQVSALGGTPELTWFQSEPSSDDVGTEFGEGSQEVLLGGASGEGDKGPMLKAENAFEGMPLFNAAVVRAAGLVHIEKPAPVHRVVRCQGQHADEFSPGLMASSGNGFSDASDNHGIFPFHPTSGIATDTLDGPEARRPGISQVGLDVPVGQGSIDQHIGDTSNPFGFCFREHGELCSLAWHRTRRRSTIASAFPE